jgi:hypothetical protein
MNDNQKLYNIMKALADSVENASDEELLEESRKDGFQISQWAQSIRERIIERMKHG